jgi:hypothetical protein
MLFVDIFSLKILHCVARDIHLKLVLWYFILQRLLTTYYIALMIG